MRNGLRGARRGACAVATLAGAAAMVFFFGGTIAAILFMYVDDRVDLDTDARLPRGGPGDVLSKPVPRLADAGLAEPFVSERPHAFAGEPVQGWERVYRSTLSADGRVTVRLDAARARVREVVLPHPAPPVTLEGLAGRRAWGPPAMNADAGGARLSRWTFPVGGGEVVEATVRWRDPRPGAIDEIRWIRAAGRP